MGRKRGWTDEELIRELPKSVHLTDLRERLDCYTSLEQIEKGMQRLGLNNSHWTKCKHRFHRGSSQKKFEELQSAARIRKRYKLLVSYKCAICSTSEWKGATLVLELHHKNGDNKDNRMDNLELLCPNCHSQTNNYRNRSRKEG